MLRKNISILLFILVFTGVVLLGNTGVWAGINLADDFCDFTGDPNETGLCAEVLDSSGNKIYVIQICADDGSGVCPGAPNIPGDWPRVNADGSKTYTYSFMQHADAAADCRGVPSLNYLFLSTRDGLPPIIASNPPGPKLITCAEGLKECAEECDPNTLYVKLSFSYSCTSEKRGDPEPKLFSLTMPAGTNDDTNCGAITAVTRDGCDMGSNFIYVPSGLAPRAEDLSFLSGAIQVSRNPCSGVVEDGGVTFGGTTATPCSPWICFGVPGQQGTVCIDLVGEGKSVGPPFFGCVFDDAPIPIYGYGDQFWCGASP